MKSLRSSKRALGLPDRGGLRSAAPAFAPWLWVFTLAALVLPFQSAYAGEDIDRPSSAPGEGAGSVPAIASMPTGITLVGRPADIFELAASIEGNAPIQVFETAARGEIAVSFGGDVTLHMNRQVLASSPVKILFNAGVLLGPGLVQVGIDSTRSGVFGLQPTASFALPLASFYAPTIEDPSILWLGAMNFEGAWYTARTSATGDIVTLHQTTSF